MLWLSMFYIMKKIYIKNDYNNNDYLNQIEESV